MTSPLPPYTGGFPAAPFPDTPIYDSLVAERGAPQIAPIRVPAAYEPVGPQLAPPPSVLPPALPALPSLPSGSSEGTGQAPGPGLRPAHTAYPVSGPVPPQPPAPMYSSPEPGQSFAAPAPGQSFAAPSAPQPPPLPQPAHAAPPPAPVRQEYTPPPSPPQPAYPSGDSFAAFGSFRNTPEPTAHQQTGPAPHWETGRELSQSPAPHSWQPHPTPAAPEYAQQYPAAAPRPRQPLPRRPTFPDPYTQQPYQYPTTGY